ncbi:MAG: V-type ATPase subunit [Pleomorphochaeta sp.]
MKRAVDTYGFINAKLRAKIGNIRNTQLQDDLLKAGSLVEAIGILKEHGYENAAEVYDKTGDLQLVELSLLNDEIKDLINVQKYLNGYPKELIICLLTRIEAENVKNSIRLWYSSAIHKRPISYRSAYIIKTKIVNDINYTSIINAITFDNIIDAVNNTFYEKVLSDFTLEDIQQNGLFWLESAIDLKIVDLIYEATSKLKNDDYNIAMKLFKMEIDLKNIIMLIRYGWFHKLESEELNKILYPYSSVFKDPITKSYINSNPKNRNVESLFKGKYGELSNLVNNTVTDKNNRKINQIRDLEKYLYKKKGKLFENCLGGKPFTIGTALAYYYLREQQYTIICGILGSKYYDADVQDIKGLM